MKLQDVDSTTEDAFLRCLHLEADPDPEVMALRRRWFDRYRERGLRAKVLVDDDGTVVGLGQYIPIEQSPFVGERLAAILCMWVHGYAHHIGNQQRKGFGRQILHGMEAEIRDAGYQGIAAWGMDFPYWNPVSWYLANRYEKADQIGPQVLVWKPFSDEARPPALLRRTGPVPVDPDKPTITVYLSTWCAGGCECVQQARLASSRLGAEISYIEFPNDSKAEMVQHGCSDGVFLNGQPYRPFEPPWTADDLIRDARQAGEPQHDGV